jgi:hypothetical protein
MGKIQTVNNSLVYIFYTGLIHSQIRIVNFKHIEGLIKIPICQIFISENKLYMMLDSNIFWTHTYLNKPVNTILFSTSIKKVILQIFYNKEKLTQGYLLI